MKRILFFLVAVVTISVVASCGGINENKNQMTEAVQAEAQESWTDSVKVLCLEERSNDPIEVLERLMSQPWCHMHGPEHHVLVGAALLTAYNNCLPDTAKLDLNELLPEVISRGRQVPGGACGYMGACGASISTGIFMSVIMRNTPFSTDTWRLCNLCTARALEQVALNGGPRCCKRDSYLSILAAVDFVRENLGIEMHRADVTCSRSQINEQCIGKKCPFSPMK